MPATFAVKTKPIKSVKVLNSFSSQQSISAQKNASIDFPDEIKKEKKLYSDTCTLLQEMITKLNDFYEQIFSGHKEQIAQLSIEIARKILLQKVSKGDYEIESIINQALKNTPTRQDLIVYLNPHDLAVCQKLQSENTNSSLSGIRFIADPNIGRAECIVETPKGIIKSLINEHLEQIGNVLEQVN